MAERRVDIAADGTESRTEGKAIIPSLPPSGKAAGIMRGYVTLDSGTGSNASSPMSIGSGL